MRVFTRRMHRHLGKIRTEIKPITVAIRRNERDRVVHHLRGYLNTIRVKETSFKKKRYKVGKKARGCERKIEKHDFLSVNCIKCVRATKKEDVRENRLPRGKHMKVMYPFVHFSLLHSRFQTSLSPLFLERSFSRSAQTPMITA